jgi:hypothetical protein
LAGTQNRAWLVHVGGGCAGGVGCGVFEASGAEGVAGVGCVSSVAADAEGVVRGIVNGLLFAVPMWAVIGFAWSQYPPTSLEHIIVYAGVIAAVGFCGFAFTVDGRCDPPSPDEYFNALSPIEDEQQTRWEDTH